MARETVLAVTCDRCGKTDHKKDAVTKTWGDDLVLDFKGVKTVQADLCEKCDKIVTEAVDTILRKPTLTKVVAAAETETPAVHKQKEQPSALPGPTAAPIQLSKTAENPHKGKS